MHVAKDEGLAEGLAEGEAKGKAECKRETAVKMLKKGMSLDDISELTGLSQEEITGLKQ
jgi:predicted transposase/invertase (TIGR01784 family)